jgi:hypothetical protein
MPVVWMLVVWMLVAWMLVAWMVLGVEEVTRRLRAPWQRQPQNDRWLAATTVTVTLTVALPPPLVSEVATPQLFPPATSSADHP